MPVYVDDMKAQFGRMVMCHMLADTSEELLAMADRIGVARKWIQYPGTHREHFDIALSKRAEAVAAGAQEITWREAGLVTRWRRQEAAQGIKPPMPFGQIVALGRGAVDAARSSTAIAEGAAPKRAGTKCVEAEPTRLGAGESAPG